MYGPLKAIDKKYQSPIVIDIFSSKDRKVKALAKEETERAKARAAKLPIHQRSLEALKQVYFANTGINPNEKKHGPEHVFT